MQLNAVNDQIECPALPALPTKPCFTCPKNGRPELQVLSAFSKCSANADGLLNQCRRCNAELRSLRQKRNQGNTDVVAYSTEVMQPTGAASTGGLHGNIYQKLLAMQNGRCGCCKEPEHERDERQQVLRYNYYRFLTSRIEALICLRCLTLVQQTGASITRVAHLLSFVSQGYAPPTGRMATANLE